MPVVVLTGRPDLRDAVQCLDDGADDYMTKPFRFEELLARIRARLRTPRTAEVADARGRRACVSTCSARRADGRRPGDRSDGPRVRPARAADAPPRPGPHAVRRSSRTSGGTAAEPGTNVVNVYIGALRKKLGGDVDRIGTWRRLLHAHVTAVDQPRRLEQP